MSNQNTNQNTNNQGSLLGGHVEYVRGVAESAIGSVTGSQAWTASGEQDKAHAAATMKAASENRDPAQQGFGKAEEVAGRAFGCDGMREEGIASASVKKD